MIPRLAQKKGAGSWETKSRRSATDVPRILHSPQDRGNVTGKPLVKPVFLRGYLTYWGWHVRTDNAMLALRRNVIYYIKSYGGTYSCLVGFIPHSSTIDMIDYPNTGKIDDNFCLHDGWNSSPIYLWRTTRRMRYSRF